MGKAELLHENMIFFKDCDEICDTFVNFANRNYK